MDEQQQLREQLQQLHTELERTESVDQASRDMLRHLISDVQELLDRSEEGPSQRDRPFLNRLRKGIAAFEATHPELTLTMSEVVDTLTNAGV